MARIYETLTGHRIEYDADPKIDKFIKRLVTLVEDRGASEGDVIALLYGRENPILDQSVFSNRGAVTRAVLENPVYRVMTDLLERKRLTPKQIEKTAARYTLTVKDAAERAGTHESAIRQAIAAGRLPSWKRAGVHYLDPVTVDALHPGTRGPVAPLEYRAGYDERSKAFLRIKAPTGELPVDKSNPEEDDAITRWKRVAVLTAGGGKARLFVLEPAAEKNEIKFHDYSVRGRFKVVQKVNDAARARVAWKDFSAA
ncbi:MAG TPA: hypothetical protein VG734_26070 [Lacunisphaera sp.]|nr:hypothetical protein [Lacunisphaera sp.]